MLKIMIGMLWSLQVFAQVTGDYTSPPRMRTGQRHRNATAPDKPPQPSPGRVVGHCTVLKGGGNLVEGPCLNLWLVLKEAGGRELLRAVTDRNGDFAFENEGGDDFAIEPASRAYSVVGPRGEIHPGTRVELNLKQN